MANFTFGLNTSTIRPSSLMDKIRIAGEAGYDAIELWITDVEQYLEDGHPLNDVVKALDDQGLDRPSMITLRGWCDADDQRFDKAMEEARRRLDIARKLGIRRIVASPPREVVPLDVAIDRYSELLELSVNRGVPASVEFLGFVDGINNLETAWAICAGAARSEGTVTPDAWHMFRGGTKPETLDSIPADHISCFHWNDAPAEPPRAQQTDADRVHCGKGIMDLQGIADQLSAKPWNGCLTLELFNPTYWKQDPMEVARTGLALMKQSVGQS